MKNGNMIRGDSSVINPETKVNHVTSEMHTKSHLSYGYTNTSWCSPFFEGKDDELKNMFKSLVKKDSLTKVSIFVSLLGCRD